MAGGFGSSAEKARILATGEVIIGTSVLDALGPLFQVESNDTGLVGFFDQKFAASDGVLIDVASNLVTNYVLKLSGNNTSKDVLFATANGNVGFGVTTFGTNAAGVLGIANADTVPDSSPIDMIQIYSKDSSLGAANATFALRTEQGVEAIGVFTPSHKLRIWIDEVEYWFQLEAI